MEDHFDAFCEKAVILSRAGCCRNHHYVSYLLVQDVNGRFDLASEDIEVQYAERSVGSRARGCLAKLCCYFKSVGNSVVYVCSCLYGLVACVVKGVEYWVPWGSSSGPVP